VGLGICGCGQTNFIVNTQYQENFITSYNSFYKWDTGRVLTLADMKLVAGRCAALLVNFRVAGKQGLALLYWGHADSTNTGLRVLMMKQPAFIGGNGM
jgi:hypothetical protein